MSITVTHGRHKRIIVRTRVAALAYALAGTMLPAHADLSCTRTVIDPEAINAVQIAKQKTNNTGECDVVQFWLKQKNGKVVPKGIYRGVPSVTYTSAADKASWASWDLYSVGDDWRAHSFTKYSSSPTQTAMTVHIQFLAASAPEQYYATYTGCGGTGTAAFYPLTRQETTASWTVRSLYEVPPIAPGETASITIPAPYRGIATLRRTEGEWNKFDVRLNGLPSLEVSVGQGMPVTVKMTAYDVEPGTETRHYTATLHCP